MLSGDALRDYLKHVVSPMTGRRRTGKHARISLLDTQTLSRSRNDSCFSAENRRDVLRWAFKGLQQRFKAPRQNKAQESWHDSKNALYVIAGSRSMFLTTHEGDMRRRSQKLYCFCFLRKPHRPHHNTFGINNP